MKQAIKALESNARELEATIGQRAEWMEALLRYTEQYLRSLPEQKAFYWGTQEGRAISETPIGKTPMSMEAILDLYKRNVSEVNINPPSGRHFGYIPGGGIFHSAMADYLAAVTNPYAGMYFAGPGAVRLENQVIRWLCELVGYTSAQSFGNLTSGGSIANLTAITAARDWMNVTSKEVERSVIYYTRQVHHCVVKALRTAGLREAITREVPMDKNLRMKVADLQEMIETDKAAGLNPFLIVASAGTTDVGIIDPLEPIADIAAKHHLWFHVDAAYGGAFLLSEVKNADGTSVKDQFKGIARADSITLDPHKGFFLPYGLGAVLVKNIDALYKSNSFKANYLQDADSEEEPTPNDISVELSKHFRGLRLWLPLQLIGENAFKAALDEKILLTRYFHEEVQKLGFEVGPYPELSITTYRFIPKEGNANDYNRQLLHRIWEDGRFFVSSTTIAGVYWIRLCVLGFRTHLEEVDQYLSFLKQLVKEENMALV
ncbi:MAG: amino acid decarboxylase [Saprospiraceae bacterium]|nr:amino acid decarboxylase [Saprospiraceae bacterium]